MDFRAALNVLEGFLSANGFQLTALKAEDQLSSAIDFGFREKFFRDVDYAAFWHNLDRLITPGVLFHFRDDLGLYYSFFRLQDDVPGGPLTLIVGPYLTEQASRDQVQKIVQERKISQILAADVMEFFNRLPLSPPFEFWNNSMSFFMKMLCGRNVVSRFVTNEQMELFQASFSDYRVPDAYELAWKLIEERYVWEQRLMDAVSRGDLEEAAYAHRRFVKFRLVPRVRDALRNRKNMLIIFNTLLRKSIQAGGVHPVHIDRISTRFATELENATSVDSLNVLAKTMLREYCALVKNYSHKSFSPMIRACVNFIDFHYAEDLSLHGLAEKLAVTEPHLSRTFKRETGFSLIEYLNRTRVKESLFLLQQNELSITNVALQCGFSSATYFDRVFKKVYKMSPREYQQSIFALE